MPTLNNQHIRQAFYILLTCDFLLDCSQTLELFFVRPLYRFAISSLVGCVLVINTLLQKKQNTKPFILLFILYNIAIGFLSFTFSPSAVYTRKIISFLPTFFYPFALFFFADLAELPYFIQWSKKIVLPIFLVVSILALWLERTWDGWSFYNAYLLLFFYAYFDKRTRFLLISALIVSVWNDIIIDERASLLYLLSLILIILISKRFQRLIQTSKLLVFIPLIYILIWVTTASGFSFLSQDDDSFFNDTRTFLYQEVYEHLETHHAVLWGTTLGKGYKTSLRDVEMLDMTTGEKISYYEDLKEGRISSECQLANYFHWGGLINVLLLTLAFFIIVHSAMKQTPQNKLAVMMIYYVIFRVVFTYGEGVQTYLFQSINLWMAVALLMNENFLYMSQDDIEDLFAQAEDSPNLFP